MHRLVPDFELTPFRIALVYTVFGTVSLFVSDVLFVRYFSEPLLSRVQALKGGVEVVLTAGFIFVLVARRESQLQRTLRQLDRQREELTVLHRVLRHNLRNGLNVIQGYAEQIRSRDTPDRIDQECGTILETAEKILHYTEQANRIREITDRNGGVQTFDVIEILAEIAENVSGEQRERERERDVEVTTTFPDSGGVSVEANPMFRDALEELITNAIKHNDSDVPSVAIDVHAENGLAHMVEITIADNGPGIPESELEPLREGGESQLFHLSGVGLWFVKWTVRHSGGELRFEERDPRGTVVTVLVPKAPDGLSSVLSPLNAD